VYVLTVTPREGGESMLDRTQFEGALRHLRFANYRRIMRRLQSLAPVGGRKVLDVGCSSGWFLEVASQVGYECYGIEPDGFFYSRLASAPPPGARLVQGFFARDLPADWGPFDLITFHDVFEHLPEPAAVLGASRHRLARGGYIVLSLPVADGIVFRLARVLYHLGVKAPLERMFQINYPYPHLFYFTRRSIDLLARRAGFELVAVERLRSFSFRGAYHRARMDRALDPVNTVKRYASTGALLVFAAVERCLPADNVLAVLRVKAS
jgi:SAM-dependent methyltransferase